MFHELKEYLKHRLKLRLAGQELSELYILQHRIQYLKVCSDNKAVSAAAAWLEDPESYPHQFKSYHGGIEDFREYLRKLDKEEV